MKMKKLSAFILVFAGFSEFTVASQTHWDYDVSAGPAKWGQLSPDYSLCETGRNQSPVNINGVMDAHVGQLQLSWKPVRQEIINNGHTVQINTSKGDVLELDGREFTLLQFHFHTPSENEVDGKRFPLEAHFVYKDMAGSLAVVALMFHEGDENEQLSYALKNAPEDFNKVVSINSPVEIKALLPEDLSYYRYSGSLTTPPCTEGVRWLVLKDPVNVSREQINKFRALIHKSNSRPVQPLNGRVIVD